MRSSLRPALLAFLAIAAPHTQQALSDSGVIAADPSNFRQLVRNLRPGDTLKLTAGTYPPFSLYGLNGTDDAWITVSGPDSGPPAVISGAHGSNTIEIFNCSYVAVENLRIDSRGIPGAFGISAKGHEENLTHHIRIEGNTLVGQNGGQQTDGISTKIPTWGWVIRYNRILGAGTGLYLGESDGTQPFVNGLIEHNLIQDTIGYNMEIKDQISLPAIAGMPTGPTSTIIRHNVFIKNDQPSPDGDRPNLLVGAFPATGDGSLNQYEIYGNLFLHNGREALFQGSGRISLHDNLFVDGPYTYPAIMLRRQNYPLKVAVVYNNTVYTTGKGISFGSRAELYDSVVGNLVFGSVPISGQILHSADNLVAPLDQAASYVKSPSFKPGPMDFYPLPGRCSGKPLDLSDFHLDRDYSLDFNGTSKVEAKGAAVFRGAYAAEGNNPGWQPAAEIKPPNPPLRTKVSTVVWSNPASAETGSAHTLTVFGADFTPGASVAISGSGVEISDVQVVSDTEIDAKVKIAPGAAPGLRDLTVRTPAGTSKAASFRIHSRRGGSAAARRPA